MLKKFLAGLTAVALSLGMVALTASPASAHHSTISATVACSSPTAATITWSVQNWNGGKTSQVVSSTNNLVPAGTQFASNETKQFTQNVTSTGWYNLSVTMKWWDGDSWENETTNDKWFEVKSSHFSACAEVTPLAPTFTNAQCTGPGTYGQASYTIPATTGVKYWVSINDQPYAVQTANTYFVSVGTKVEVYAEELPGYDLKGNDNSWKWDKTFSSPDCDQDVTPTKPTIVQAVCTGEGQVGDGAFTIPAITGVQYKVWDGNSWENIGAGAHSADDGDTVQIRAYPAAGYDLTDHDHNKEYKSYTLEFDDITSSKCDVPTAPTFTAQVCTGPGSKSTASYTIPSDSGIKYQVRINGGSWQTVNGTPVTVNVTVFPRLVEVQALPNGNIIVPGSTTYWSLNFTSAGDCLVNAYPVQPTWTDSICEANTTGSTQATFEVFATANVTYQVSSNGVDYAPISAGVHNATAGTTVWIKAVPATGYQLAGDAGPWSHLFASPGDCLDPAYPAAAAFTDSVCEADTTGATQGTYEVFAATHVAYEVTTDGGTTWTPVSVGVHNANPGDSVTIRAVADAGYILQDYTGPWSHTFADPGKCLDEAFPGDPKFVDSICEADTTGSTQATYEIVAATNVTYEISFNGVDYTTVGASVGVHNATPGTEIWIKAIADPGYEILGQTVWNHKFLDPGSCLDDAPVEPVVTSDQECVIDDLDTGAAHMVSGTITIPNTPNVTYSVDGVVTAAGSHDYAPGVYTISAEADPGYLLGAVPDPWTVEIVAAEPCGDLITFGDFTPVATFKQTTCSASGTYTLAVDPQENAAGAIWTVSGGLPNTLGTHSVTNPGTVTVTATAAPGWGISGSQTGFVEWEFDFAGLPDDCLPTLALTGGSIAAGGLGLGVLFTLGGILVFNARRRDLMAHEG